MDKLYKNRKWLYNQYWEEKLSTAQIAGKCGITKQSIDEWMKKFNISFRSINEAVHLAQANHCQLSQEANQFIEGELLGDGCLKSTNKYSARFSYASKYEKYINYISNTLNSFGIKQSGKISKYYEALTSKNGKWIKRPISLFPYAFSYCSKSYPELKVLYNKWYPNGKKIVPGNLELTPLICRQWYIGDGCLRTKGRFSHGIEFATCDFTIKDIKYLINKLNLMGFKTSYQKFHRIYIFSNSVLDFLDYIGKCPCKVYDYKWIL